MSHTSIWKGTSEETNFPVLAHDVTVDVAIVGGGITGLISAMLLTQEGKKVAVIEANQVGTGTTGHSTGNLYEMLTDHLYSIREKWDDETLKMVVHSRKAAIDLIEESVNRYKIECGFGRCGWYLFTTPTGRQQDPSVEKEFDAMGFAGLKPEHISVLPYPFPFIKGIRVMNQAQFHPLNFVSGLARKIASDQCLIFENSNVTEYDANKGVVKTDQATVRCDQIILATHTPKGFNVVQAEMIVAQEFGLAARLKDNNYPQGIFWPLESESKYSFRSYWHNGQKYLMVIGEMHLTGHEENTQQYYDRLEAYARSNFDIESIDYMWLGQHYRPADKLPYIGQSLSSSDLYIATGFSTDGLVYGALSAMIITDEIMGRGNPWGGLYRPTRFDPIKGGKEILKEQKDVVKYMVKDYVMHNEVKSMHDINPGEGAIIEVDGRQVATYRDEQGEIHGLSPVCPHMKCRVHWSNAEKTWDCPCHGSRFRKDGSVLEGPALHSLERREIG